MYTIRFVTESYRPDLLITLRGNVFGDWQEDIPGLYNQGAWEFKLPYQPYPAGVQFKFVLEREYWQLGADNLTVFPEDGGIYSFNEGPIAFPPQNEIIVENSRVQRHFIQPNLNEAEHYDTIVIGSGMGGGVVAEQLADLGQKVLLLEAGSYIFPTHVANLPRRQRIGVFDKHLWQTWPDFQTKNYQNPEGHNYQGAAGFNLGGRSIFWGGLIPRMAWWELEPWPTNVRYDLEDTYYRLAEDLMKLSRLSSSYQERTQRWFNREFPEFNVSAAPMAVQRGNGEMRTLSAGVFNTAALLLEAVMTADTDLTVNLNHAVKELVTQNGRVTGVVAYDLVSRMDRTYHANTVVLAAGSVESAKIAQLSQLNDPNNLIGNGFTDHQVFFTHFGLPNTHELFQTNASAKLALRQTVESDRPEHRYLAVVELGADFNQGRYIDPDLAETHVRTRGDSMLCELVFLCESPLMNQNTVMQEGPSYVDAAITMEPSNAADGLIGEMDQYKQQILERLNATVLPGDNHYLNEAALGGVAHEVGTLRMGNGGAGVVDTNLKFHQYENLFCCDLSVFPTSPAANPSLTLVALALRLADHLRG
ncbi:GMC family oxidoreductase [Oscillatoria sp. CS-180]|uniref:GMC oxidoreductase n=1 Tax=Oscillatoria sp. CS-180 TaxID=3021720 RepID=UPI00232F93AD|nr:GMC family oxidoreductase [Oscillatoria sp. CS-180]MDB9525941.1 GMC family oxidoreductase [Oscillatoria sp. CS-180]